MAKLNSPITFTGSIQNLTAYQREGFDKIILQTKGGPSPEKFHNSPTMDVPKRNSGEFTGRSKASHWVIKALKPLQPLADYNIAGPLNGLFCDFQQLDTVNPLGSRSVLFTRAPQLLQGFSLNRIRRLEATLRSPLDYLLSRETLQALVEVPALLPGNNFTPPVPHPLYRFMATLALVPDVVHRGLSGYGPEGDYEPLGPSLAVSDWYAVNSGSEPFTMELALPYQPPGPAWSLMLSVGIQFGTLRNIGVPQPVRRAGSAKVLGMV